MRHYVKMATVAEALEKSPSGFFPAVPFDKSIAPDGVPSFCAGATIRSHRKGRLSVGRCAAAKGYALDAAPCLATTSAHTLGKNAAKFFATFCACFDLQMDATRARYAALQSGD